MTAQPEVRILESPQALFHAGAEEFVRLANEAVRARGRFTVALAGGSTPNNLYTLLAGSGKDLVPWDKICFFFGDERHVPPDHHDSNYRMACETMLSKVPVPRENVFRVPAENPDASAAAYAYEQTLQKFFHLKKGEFPSFDLVLLGMGPDGHTASLFPHTSALHDQMRLVAANWVEKFKTYRITFTYPVINHAGWVIFLVAGVEKQEVLREVLHGKSAPEQLPSQGVRPVNGRLIWMVDQAAAGKLG